MPQVTKTKKKLVYVKRIRRTRDAKYFTEFDLVDPETGEYVGYVYLMHEKSHSELVKGRKGPLPEHFHYDQIILNRGFDIPSKPKYTTLPGKSFTPYVDKLTAARKAQLEAKKKEKTEEPEPAAEPRPIRKKKELSFSKPKAKSPIEQMRETYPEMDDDELQQMLDGSNDNTVGDM